MKKTKLKNLPPPGPNVNGWCRDAEASNDPPEDGEWPKISVITPSYNQADYLEETIRSVLLQKYPNLEYLVIDGSSRDGSVDILKKYDKWIDYWVSEPDEGQTQAINKGVEKATGDWIIYINSDDILYPGALLKVGRKAQEQPGATWIAGSTQVFGAEGNYNIKKPDTKGIEKPGNWISYKVHVPQHSSFVRSDIYRELGNYDENLQYVFDLEFGLRMGFNGLKPMVIDDVLAGFRIHGSSKTEQSRLPFLREQEELIEKYSDAMKRKEIEETRKTIHSMIASNTIYDSLKEQNATSGTILKAVLKAISIDSSIITKRHFWGALKQII